MKIQFKQPLPFLTATANPKIHFTNVNEQKDQLTIGTQAKQLFSQNTVVDRLMKQRESLLEMKNSITAEDDASNITEKMKQLEKQLAELDEQIAQAQKEKQEANDEQTTPTKAKSLDEVIFSQAGSLDRAKTLQKMKRSLTREKTTLANEVKLDASRGVHSEFKENRLAKIDDQLSFMQDSIGQNIEEALTNTTEAVVETTKKDDQTNDELTVQEQIAETIVKTQQ